jgi:hypothetical protein
METILNQINNLDDDRSTTWHQFNDLYKDFSKIQEESFSALKEEFDKNSKVTTKFQKLREVDETIWAIYDEAIDGLKNWCENDHLFTLDKKLCSTARVTRTKGKKIEEMNECSLCLNKHNLKHLIKTSCGHYFGKSCFAALIKHNFYNDDALLTCPNCRSNYASLQQFKYKK